MKNKALRLKEDNDVANQIGFENYGADDRLVAVAELLRRLRGKMA